MMRWGDKRLKWDAQMYWWCADCAEGAVTVSTEPWRRSASAFLLSHDKRFRSVKGPRAATPELALELLRKLVEGIDPTYVDPLGRAVRPQLGPALRDWFLAEEPAKSHMNKPGIGAVVAMVAAAKMAFGTWGKCTTPYKYLHFAWAPRNLTPHPIPGCGCAAWPVSYAPPGHESKVDCPDCLRMYRRVYGEGAA